MYDKEKLDVNIFFIFLMDVMVFNEELDLLVQFAWLKC